MPPRDLQSFLEILRAEGDLVEVDVPVDTHLEVAEIHRRVIAANGPALLFTKPHHQGVEAGFPLVTNLFGSAGRVERAFGRRPVEFVERTARLPHDLMPPTFGNIWKQRDWIGQALDVGLKQVARGPVTEVVDRPPGLDRLPMLHCWEEDGGPFITLPLVYTEHPDDGSHNLGM